MAELLSSHPFDCELHSQCWRVLTRFGQRLCLQCCQHKWVSQLETTFTRIQLLELMDSSLKYGSTFIVSVPHSERQAFLLTLTLLVFDSDPHIQSLANNCLSALLAQTSDQSINAFIFETVFQNISSDANQWNESIFALMSYLLSVIPVETHPLKNDIYFVLQCLRTQFNTFDGRLKTSVLRLFVQFYENCRTNGLFALNEDLHLKALQMVFDSFESQTQCPNNTNVLIHSILLLKKLSEFDSVVNAIMSDNNLTVYLKALLDYECEELIVSLIDWICNLLENESISKVFANVLLNEIIDSFIHLLYSSENPFLSNHILNAINLILDNISRPFAPLELMSFSKSITKALELSVKTKDNKFFMNALTALRQLMEKNKCIQLVSEFEFFALIDLFECLLSESQLFTTVVDFLSEFLNVSVVPVLIPTSRLKTLLEKVLDNISVSSSVSTDDEFQQSITRTTCAANLIKSYLILMISLFESDFGFKDNSLHLLNGENKFILNELNSNLSEIQESVNDCKRSEVYPFFAFCFSKIQSLFTDSLDKLLSNCEQFSELISIQFQTICSSFMIVLEKSLFLSEDIIGFITRLFANGSVLALIQLLCVYEYEFITTDLKTCLASLLSYFLIKMLKEEHPNHCWFHIELSVDRKTFENSLIQMSDNLLDHLITNSCSYQMNDTIRQFYSTFFAINYFCFKFDKKKCYKIEDKYSAGVIRILNQYLKKGLSPEPNSVLIIKHSLFLSTLTELDEQSLSTLRKFFHKRDNNFLSLYYTNHMILLKWLFNELKSDNFCEYALNAFFDSIPGNYMNFETKDIISDFFVLISYNERALQIFISIMCDTITNESTLDVIKYLLEDSQQFIDESDICNNWNSFCIKVLENMPKIIVKLIKSIKTIATKAMDSTEERKLAQMVALMSRMFCSDSNKSAFNSYKHKFIKFLNHLSALIDQSLSDSTTQTILEFFRICFTYSSDLDLNPKDLTESLLNSKTAVILIINTISNGQPIEAQELSFELLSVLAENKFKHKIKHQLVYDLDINRLIDWLNSDSDIVAKSAAHLVMYSFKTDSYFSENSNKSEEQKSEELRKLLFSLQNAFFRTNITLAEMSFILKSIFKDLSNISYDLMKHLANSPWFLTIVSNYMQTNDIFSEELIDFLIIFYELDFINKELIEITNEITNTFIESIESTERLDSDGSDVWLKDKIFQLFRAIDSGIYKNILNKENKQYLYAIRLNN